MEGGFLLRFYVLHLPTGLGMGDSPYIIQLSNNQLNINGTSTQCPGLVTGINLAWAAGFPPEAKYLPMTHIANTGRVTLRSDFRNQRCG